MPNTLLAYGLIVITVSSPSTAITPLSILLKIDSNLFCLSTTSLIFACNWSAILLNVLPKEPISSFERDFTLILRSPPAIRAVTFSKFFKGSIIVRTSFIDNETENSITIVTIPIYTLRLVGSKISIVSKGKDARRIVPSSNFSA